MVNVFRFNALLEHSKFGKSKTYNFLESKRKNFNIIITELFVSVRVSRPSFVSHQCTATDARYTSSPPPKMPTKVEPHGRGRTLLSARGKNNYGT